MDLISFKKLLTSYGNGLRSMLLPELLRGLSILGMAGSVTAILQGVFLENGNWREAAPMLLVLLFSMFCRNMAEYFIACRASELSAEFREKIRLELHPALFRTGNEKDGGRLMMLAFETVESFDDLFRQVLPNLISCLILLPLFLVVMLRLEFFTALLFILTLPIVPALLFLIGQVTKERNERAWQRLKELNAGFHELLQGLATWKLFGRSRQQLSRLQELSRSSGEAVLHVLQLAFVSSFALELITTLSIALIAVSIGLRLLAGSLDFFTAFLALLIAPEFYQPLRQGGTAFHAGIKAKQGAEKLRDFIGSPVPQGKGRMEKLRVPPSVNLRNVSFRYPGQSTEVLRQLTMEFPAGSTTVLAGTSGSGKSTLLKLLAGLYPPSEGEILLGEFPMERAERSALSRLIAYVPQTPHIFHGTLRENLTMFQPMEETKILSAVRRSGMERILAKLPEGLDSPMGLHGSSLSHGQIHRLGIARALLQDAPLMLLDEVTAGLDPEGEQEMLLLLEEIRYRRTVILASHRPAVLAWAPRVIRLEAGSILSGRQTDGKAVECYEG